MEKDSLFKYGCWENWIATNERMRLEQFFIPYIKIISKWFKDLNAKAMTIKYRRT